MLPGHYVWPAVAVACAQLRELYTSYRPLLKTACDMFETHFFFLANHLELLAERTEPAQRLAARARRLQEARRRRISAYRGGHSALAADGTPLDCDVEGYECRETRVGASEKAHDSCWGGAAAGGGPDLWLRRHQPPTQGHLEQVWMLLAQGTHVLGIGCMWL